MPAKFMYKITLFLCFSCLVFWIFIHMSKEAMGMGDGECFTEEYREYWLFFFIALRFRFLRSLTRQPKLNNLSHCLYNINVSFNPPTISPTILTFAAPGR